MKLTKLFPVAMSMACAIMLSSCSKEDAQTPQPLVESANGHSSAKTNAGEVVESPYFPATTGVKGFEKYPTGWTKLVGPNPSIPAGSSSLTSLWGLENWSNSVNPQWIKPLLPATGNPVESSFITVKSFAETSAETNDKSGALTTIKNLKPGKMYTITFYVATTTVAGLSGNGETSVAAASAEIKMLNVNSGMTTTKINFGGLQATWVKKTITFTAQADNAKFVFSGLTPLGNVYSYIHLFVDRNSIVEFIPFQPMVVQ
ncbi:hypothetical protein [Dyadobacter sp. Leaf189]|uniref:hypothetical protein n=1 Tax=Dyadobacter sp. Leaf189 TaxID=1736295 RepID=UPI0012F90F07|nr:hypothetical protein [Dyadobacter sp. Leaf189]